MSLRDRSRKSSASSSSGPEEEPDFMSEDYHKLVRPTTSTTQNPDQSTNGTSAQARRSFTKAGNLWSNLALEQSLNEDLTRGAIVADKGRSFDRGAESYVMKQSDFDEFQNLRKAQREKEDEGVENPFRKPTPDPDEIFNPASNEAPTTEFGVKGHFRTIKRKARAGRFGPQGNRPFRHRRNSQESMHTDEKNGNGVFSYSNRKRRFMGSRDSLSSTSSRGGLKRIKEIPKDLVVPDYSLEKLLAVQFPKHLEREEFGQALADALGDQNPETIIKAVELAGKEICLTLFKETQRIEENGGMLIFNKSRRRTPGGVFLSLFRQNTSISQDVKTQLHQFGQNLQKEKEEIQKQKEAEKTETMDQDLPRAGDVLPVTTE